jgi:hypothetical protein
VLFTPGDVGALSTELGALAGSPSRRHMLATAGLRQASTRTWPAVFDALFADYTRLAGRRVW